MTALAAATSPQLAATRDAVLVVPVGSTEQHGPHLPVTTDTDVAVAVATRLAQRRDDVVVAPPVTYGASGEHQSFAGTVSIGTEALRLLLVELVRSATQTWSRVLIVNAHGGNADAVAAAVATCLAEGRDVRSWSPTVPAGDAHAGRTETSLMLAARPAAVRVHAAAAGAVAPLRELMPVLRTSGVAAVSPNGVLGDPAGASAEQGAALLDAFAADLAAVVAGWA